MHVWNISNLDHKKNHIEKLSEKGETTEGTLNQQIINRVSSRKKKSPALDYVWLGMVVDGMGWDGMEMDLKKRMRVIQ